MSNASWVQTSDDEVQSPEATYVGLGICSACGKPASSKASTCPHCGHPINLVNSSATMVLVFGILGVLVPVYGVVFGGLGWGFGNREIHEIKAGLRVASGRRRAQVGRVLGMIGTLLWSTVLVVMVISYLASGPDALSQGQDGVYRLHLDGVEMIEDGQWEGARFVYTQIIEEFPPEDPDALGRAHMNRAIALYELGLYEEAIADETAVIDLKPSDSSLLAQAFLNRSREHSYLNMDDESVADATAVINLQPEDTTFVARALVNRGITMRERGQLREAVSDWTTALGLNPEPDVHISLLVFRSEVYFALGRNEEATDDATDAIEAAVIGEFFDGTRVTNAELLVRAHITRGTIFGEAGSSQDALKDLTAAIELRPEDNHRLAQAHLVRAMVHYDLYHDAEAIADIQQVTTLVPPDHEMHRLAIEMLTDISESA